MKKYKIITYGCQMNVHESEKLSGIMQSLGYINTEIDNEADFILFNTCCIRDNAERKAIGNITAYKKLKESKPSLMLIVLGCMTQQESTFKQFKVKYPYIDIVLGNHNKYDIETAIQSRLNNKKRYLNRLDSEYSNEYNDNIISRTSGINAWVSIMHGCNNFCSYCIVPYVRGRERSRSREQIVNEVKDCIDKGYKEITLLGQNVNSYGLDIGGAYAFADLLEELASLKGKFRINYMTSHPKDFNRRVVDIIRDYDNVSNYIHLPIQSGSNKILSLMNRKYTREQYMDIIDYIKQEIPTAGITTDIMVGFPHENDEDFENTLDIVNRVKYINAFMFIYSSRVGTPAADMEQIEEDIKNSRIQRLIELQRSITEQHSESLLGSVQEVLAEDNSPRFKNMLCGRSYQGKLVHFEHTGKKVGDFVDVKIISNKAAALIGIAKGDKDE